MADYTPTRVFQYTSTVGTGDVTLDGAAVYPSFFTGNEVAFTAGDTGVVLLQEGDDVELSDFTAQTLSPLVISRDTVLASRISGVAGTTKMSLGGTATVQFVIHGDRFDAKGALDRVQTWTKPQTPGAGTISDSTSWDAAAKQYNKITVNGAAFTVSPPTGSPSVVEADTVYLFRVSYSTSHAVTFDNSFFKGAIDTGTATAGAVDYFCFMGAPDGLSLEYLGSQLDAAQ